MKSEKTPRVDMMIRIPATLAAKLRHRLAELEIPEYVLRKDVLGGLENTLEDDALLLGGWVYDSRADAERIARRIFARRDRDGGVRRCEVMYGKDVRTVEFFNPEPWDGEPEENRTAWLQYIQERIQRHPGRCFILSSRKTVLAGEKEVAS